MTPQQRYVLAHWVPFAVLVLILFVGFAWTAAQERTIRDNSTHYDSLVSTLRAAAAEQCAFDRSHSGGTAPDYCQEYQP